jgi:hypothetical protein
VGGTLQIKKRTHAWDNVRPIVLSLLMSGRNLETINFLICIS